MPDRTYGNGKATFPGWGSAIKQSLYRELLIGFRRRGDLANPLVFFLGIILFVPLGISADNAVLASIAPGMIWIVSLLATLLSLDRLFQDDYEDGTLEQLVISGQPLYWLVLVKVLVHWFITGLPLTLLSPLLGIMMSLPTQGFLALLLSLLIGTACLSLIGAIGAALTVALARGGLVLSLIIIPLYIPILIFGSSVVRSAVDGLPFVGPLALMGAFLCIALLVAPLAIAGALKVGVNS